MILYELVLLGNEAYLEIKCAKVVANDQWVGMDLWLDALQKGLALEETNYDFELNALIT